jgi:hypothetical protein
MRNRLLLTLALIVLTSANAAEIRAQKVVTEIKAAHPEITGLELAASRSEQEGCKTIAATEVKEIGEKCDEDEFAAMKTDQPFVEKEKDEFDATLPIHDAAGKIIGTVGMDFKAGKGQTKETVTHQAKQIVSELEKRITAKEQLFESAK